MVLEMKEESGITDVTPKNTEQPKTNNHNLFGMEAEEDTTEINFDEYTRANINQVNVGNVFEGKPVIMKFENEEKNYDTVLIKLLNDTDMECLDVYVNTPKFKNQIKNIRKRNNFTLNLFNLIISVNKLIDPSSIMDPRTGDEINLIKKINLQDLLDFLKEKESIKVKVIEGSQGYNSFKIVDIK